MIRHAAAMLQLPIFSLAMIAAAVALFAIAD